MTLLAGLGFILRWKLCWCHKCVMHDVIHVSCLRIDWDEYSFRVFKPGDTRMSPQLSDIDMHVTAVTLEPQAFCRRLLNFMRFTCPKSK